jgi:hypothetical protein
MADFAEWGAAASPDRLVWKDQQEQLLNMLQAGATAAQIPEHQALTRLYGAEAGVKEQQLQQQRMFMDLQRRRMQQPLQQPAAPVGGAAEPGPEVALYGMLQGDIEAAKDLRAAGMYDAASKIDARVTNSFSHLSTVQRNRQQENHARYQAIQDRARIFSQVLNEAAAAPIVQRPYALQQAMARYTAMTGDMDPALANGVDLSAPNALETLQRGTMTVLQQAERDYKDQDAKTRDANRRSEIALRNYRMDEKAYERRVKIRAENRGAKGSDSLSPPAADVQAGADYLLDRYPDMHTPQARDLSRDLVRLARDKMKANPALSGQEAMNKAYLEMKAKGRFSEFAKGSAPASAIPLPPSGDGEEGKYYIGANGEIRRAMKGGKWSDPIDPASWVGGTHRAAAPVEDGDDDEDED